MNRRSPYGDGGLGEVGARAIEKASLGKVLGSRLECGAMETGEVSPLENLEQVRRRPGMYIGNPDGRGLQLCIETVVARGLNRLLRAKQKTLTVTLHREGTIEVDDTGAGMNPEVDPKFGRTDRLSRKGSRPACGFGMVVHQGSVC